MITREQLTYKLIGNTGYEIYLDGVKWIVQETYIPYPAKTISESAELHIAEIIEANKPQPPVVPVEDRVVALEKENSDLKQAVAELSILMSTPVTTA